MSDDEDDEEEDYGKEEHEKEAIAEEIFQDGEGEEGGEAVDAPIGAPEEEEEEEEDESGGHLPAFRAWLSQAECPGWQ
nr:transcription elongation factor SPT6-like [Pelodiscus sinensis]|eukprot:XP_014431509.1 transcription elongation factor SPT6-like [Pelodiscus sinensis]